MSTYRYIELDSLYRNRTDWINPARFDVELGNGGVQTPLTAKDPVSDQSPIYTWNSSFDETTPLTSVVITGIDLTASASGSHTIILESGPNNLRRSRYYYNNAVLSLTDGIDTIRVRIVDYQFIEVGDKAQLTISNGLPSGFNVTGGAIENPTNNTNTALIPQLFIPAAPDVFNSFVGMQVVNITTNESKEIIEFDARTHMATLDSNTTVTWDNGGYNFVIRENSECLSGSLLGINNAGTVLQLEIITNFEQTGNFLRIISPFPSIVSGFSTLVAPYGEENRIVRYITLDGTFVTHGGAGTNTFTISTGQNADNYYVGMFLTNVTTLETREILTYDGTTKSGTVTINWGSGANGDTFGIRTVYLEHSYTVNPYVENSIFVAHGGVGTNTFQLAASASIVNDFYIGSTLIDITTGESRIVSTYNGATRTGTVSVNWTAGAIADVYIISSNYEVECFSRDNAYPLTYSGSEVSSQQMSCYEIKLLKLVLPNGTLSTGIGGRIAFFPYVYVQLQNVSAPGSGLQNIIYSNNPHARKMLFRATVDDTQNPDNVPFAKLRGDGMTQTIKFKPNDVLRFGVYLPNGELFELMNTDTVSPTPPNPLLQISAAFGIKKL